MDNIANITVDSSDEDNLDKFEGKNKDNFNYSLCLYFIEKFFKWEKISQRKRSMLRDSI